MKKINKMTVRNHQQKILALRRKSRKSLKGGIIAMDAK
jgi:hypothetical protein